MDRIALLFTCLIISFTTSAQSPKAIEADLLKSFKKIDNWHWRLGEDQGNPYDSLVKANVAFIGELKKVASKPATIAQPFPALKKMRLDISTSDDGKFRIYSWNTWQVGRHFHVFNNIFQFKNGQKITPVLDTA